MVPIDITKEEMEALPLTSFRGRIEVVDSREKLEAMLPDLERCSLFGFDTESRPSFRKGRTNRVSLLQLALPDRAYLFRLQYLGLPGPLLALLSSPAVRKVGAAIHEDLNKLRKIQPFNPAGYTDLQLLAREEGIQAVSLRKLAALYLGVRISKSQQLSNWENPQLTEAQLRYAATDAWVCYKIYRKIQGTTP